MESLHPMDSAPSIPHFRTVLTVLAVFTATLGAFLAATPEASAVTLVSGPLTVDTVWGFNDTEYVLVGNVIVLPGVTLTILPGTTVRFDPGVALFVEGSLFADGMPGFPIFFFPSLLSVVPPIGVQFNATSTGSLSWSAFSGRFERPVTALESAPDAHNNTISLATYGFLLFRSGSVVADNVVLRASIGAWLWESDAQVVRNRFNGTNIGVEALTSGTPLIADNTITNITGFFPNGIHVDGASADVRDNTIVDVRGRLGSGASLPGDPGEPGGTAIGILVENAPTATVTGNAIDLVRGGPGGDGAPNGGGAGGPGGFGGSAVGIVVSNVPVANVQNNAVTNVTGGAGGDGGGNSTTTFGGPGGEGGSASGIEVYLAATSATLTGNFVADGTGGAGGDGSVGSTSDGNGGSGGDATGLFFWNAMDANASANAMQTLQGGRGGNSSVTGAGRGLGGPGGGGMGILGVGIAGSNTVFDVNTVTTTNGGGGGLGRAGGGFGGDALGIVAFGNADSPTNATAASLNQIDNLVGGDGGIGFVEGGPGGGAAGFAIGLVTSSLSANDVRTLRGGDGGDALDGTNGGRGGDATGVFAFDVPDANSAGDIVDNVVGGAFGAGPPAIPSFGTGFFLQGNPAVPTRMTIDNATITNTGDLDLYVSNYADGTTINTPFSAVKILIEPAGNLTVRNFLGVDAFWPDGTTLVQGASILVEDNGSPAWSLTSATGQERWLLVTDRMYINSNVATDNTTQVTISYLAYGFGSNPRMVDMATTHAEAFVMVDTDAPTSTAGVLPTYTTVANFTVPYTASDGNGTGLDNITLWYRKDGAGWTPDATQSAASSGVFNFTSVGDGVYEFATIADDLAGNVELGPGANETWTIIDTVLPGSYVVALATYQTSASFLVSWAPDAGVTDIATYTIRYNRQGTGWVDWLIDTTLTSDTFTASPAWGLFEFRSIATDLAGNVEIFPAGNDTWTIVDTEPPTSTVIPLPTYQTSLTFPVSWGPEGDSFDIATYRIEVNDDGAGWTVWLPATNQTSGMFTGMDGRTYEFRSIATDYAGNVELTPAGNETWTIVDVSLPGSSVAALPLYSTSLTIPLAWGPDLGITDIATYTIEVSDDGGPWTPIPGYVDTAATSGVFPGVDGHTYEFRSIATDFAGNVEAASPGNDTWTIVDVTAPTSSSSLSGTMGANGWWTSDVTVTLSAVDATSGVASISHRVDAGAWQTYGTPFAVSGDGNHTVEYYATDNAGLAETTRFATFDVDATPPSSSPSLTGTVGNNSWYTSDVTVDLAATDATSGVDSISYRVDGGAWQTYASPFAVGGDGNHTVEYYATDNAGLAEAMQSVAFNVDVTTPVTSHSLFGTIGDNAWYTTAVTVTLTSADVASGVVSISYRINNGTWQTYSGPLTFTTDGVYEIEYYATDGAGLVEGKKPVAFSVDTTLPFVTTSSPRGPGTNTTPVIVVTFSEPMNQASVEAGFSITPDMNGVFSWSADSRTLTFVPDRPLQPGTDYFVVVDSSARDMAGNTMPQSATFQFTTAAAPPSIGGLDVGNLWWLLAIIVTAIVAALFLVARRMMAARGSAALAAAEEEEQTMIDDVFLLYHDGILIKHATRRLKPDIDTDILSGMLTAVQHFVKDSFRSEEGELDEMTFGEMHILIGRGKWLILAAIIQGDGTAAMSRQLKKCINEIEEHHGEQVADWDGNMTLAKTLSPYVKKLIRGAYA